MDPQSFFPATLMAAAAVSALLMARYAWRWRAAAGGAAFFWLLISVVCMASANTLELVARSPAGKVFWAGFSYLGVVNLAPLWLCFSLEYCQCGAWLTRTRKILLWLVPVGMLVGVSTNPWHGLVWTAIRPWRPEDGLGMIYTHGPLFWAFAAYAYGLMAVGTYALIQTAWRSDSLYRRQAAALVVGALLPWLGNLLFILNLTPWPGVDLTSLAFLLTGFIVAWIGYRPRMFDLAPLARDILLNSVSDGVLVLDNQSRLVAINRVGLDLLGMGQPPLGQNVFDLLPVKSLDPPESVQSLHTQIDFGQNSERRIYDLTISPLLNERGGLQGRVALMHDITRERALLDVEQRRVRQMELLNALTHAALSTSDLQPMLETLVAPLCELLDANGAYLSLWSDEQQRVYARALYGSFGPSLPTISLKPDRRVTTERLLAFPLVAGEQKLGVAGLTYNQPHTFTSDELSLGEQAADQIALAVSKAQSYEKEHARNAQLMALQSVSQAIMSSLDLDQIFETVMHLLSGAFQYAYISIYRLEDEILYLAACHGYDIEQIYWQIPITKGISGRAVRTRQAQFLRDISMDGEFLCTSGDVASEICVPLLKENTVIGTLNVESPANRPLGEADVRFLTAFGSQVAVAMENARLFQAERVQRQMAEALREVGLTVNESLDFETVLDRLLDEIGRVAPYDSANVMLLDADGRLARITRMRGYEQFGPAVRQEMPGLVFEIAATPNLRQMVETGQPMIISDTRLDPGWLQIPIAAHVHSWAGAPIIAHDQVIGFFSLDKNEPGFYRPEHAERLGAFAVQTAIAIENARLFTEIQRLAHKERLLFAATRDFTAGLDEEAVLRAIVRHMIHALGVEGCTISQWDRANDCVITLMDYNTVAVEHQDVPGTVYRLADYPATRWALENCQPLRLHIDNPDCDPAERELLKYFGNQAALLLPLPAGRDGEVYGFVELLRKTNPSPFSDSDLELAQSFAAQAAAALENASLHARVKTMAMMDGLTGLANRRAFDQALEQEIARAGRYGYSLGLIITDIDSFKVYNDTYGHPAGDERLKEIASLLRATSRESDLAARYGGEEFAIILPNTSKTGAANLAERIRAAAQEAAILVNTPGMAPACPSDASPSIPGYTLSLGVAVYPEDGLYPASLLLAADNAELAAKRAGKNRVCIAGANGCNHMD